MNPKINKLKAEKSKNLRKIAEMTVRNKEIDAQLTELENLDIIGMVRDNAITPEMLAEIIRATKKNPLPDIPTEVSDEIE